MNSKVKTPENKQYVEQNQRVPACPSGIKLDTTWVNMAKVAIDRSATQEPSDLWNAGALPKSSNGKEYDEPHMFESEDMGRDINYIPDVPMSYS